MPVGFQSTRLADNVRYSYARDIAGAVGRHDDSSEILRRVSVVQPEQTLTVGRIVWVRLDCAGAIWWVTSDLPNLAAPGETTIAVEDADEAIDRSARWA